MLTHAWRTLHILFVGTWNLGRSGEAAVNGEGMTRACPQAMEQLDVGMAIRVYRELGDAGMVMALEEVRPPCAGGLLLFAAGGVAVGVVWLRACVGGPVLWHDAMFGVTCDVCVT